MELHTLSIREMAERIRSGALSPVALTEHYLERISHYDGGLGAYRMVLADRALAEARAAETALKAGADLGPLHGIPYAAKDLLDVTGLPTTAGWPKRESHRATEDATVVRRLAQAGMVLLGKTNLVQFAYGGVGINHHHGTPRNPWNKHAHCVPGGSSSGSGVAVAAGMAPMGVGSDTGGSVRIPAALNGVAGLKTTVGRVSKHGVFPLSPSLDTIGPLCRTVEDCALTYQAMHGPDPADPLTAGLPLHDTLATLGRGVKGLRLAIAEDTFWENVDREVGRAVRDAGRVLKELGASVESVPFPEAGEAAKLNANGLVIAAEAYTLHQEALERQFDEIDPVVAHRAIRGKEFSAADYIGITTAWQELRARAVDAMRDIDALLVPTTAIPARDLTEIDRSMDSYSTHNLLYLRNTAIGNILNLCAVSVPCGFTDEGMPIGLMIYGKPYDEAGVLRIARAYEQATEWHQRVPDLSWVPGAPGATRRAGSGG